MALDPNAPEVTEVEILRNALQRMTCARVEAEARAQDAVVRAQCKEREVQLITKRLQEVQELLKCSEDCQKILEWEVRRTLEIFDGVIRPPAGLAINVEGEKKQVKLSKKLRKPHIPFLLWCKDKRQQICDAHPTASTADLYAIMVKTWDTVSADDKIHYSELYSEEFKKYLRKVTSQCEASETDQVQTISSGIDNIKQKAMSLLGQYLASKKVQITQTGIEVFSAPGMSNSSSSVTSTADQRQITNSIAVLPEALEPKTHLGMTNGADKESGFGIIKESAKQELLESQEDAGQLNPSAYLLFSMERRKTLPLNAPGMTHSQMNAAIAKLWRDLTHEDKIRWNELANAVQNTEIADEKITLCIPAGLKVEKSTEEAQNENADQNKKLPSWIYDKRMLQKAEDDRKIGPREQNDRRMWEHLRNLPVNTFTV